MATQKFLSPGPSGPTSSQALQKAWAGPGSLPAPGAGQPSRIGGHSKQPCSTMSGVAGHRSGGGEWQARRPHSPVLILRNASLAAKLGLIEMRTHGGCWAPHQAQRNC